MLPAIPDYLRDLNIVSMILRLVLSVAFGAIIGIERERKRRPAGIRTYTLVCLGAALVMTTNQYITDYFNVSDPARLGAAVISGIGFLGAGTIIVTGQRKVVGLTTAAGLWASACMGLAIGIGFYEGAIVAGILILVIMALMTRVDDRVATQSAIMEIYVEVTDTEALSYFLSYIVENGIRINYIELIQPQDPTSRRIAALITLRLPKKTDHDEVLLHLKKAENIHYLVEV